MSLTNVTNITTNTDDQTQYLVGDHSAM